MPTRTLQAGGRTWRVFPSGRVTQYDRDEFAILFLSEDNGTREMRVTRYSPVKSRSRERSLAEMTDAELLQLFQSSQPGETSPEVGYAS